MDVDKIQKEITPLFQHKVFVEKTFQQIEKDFEKCGIKITFNFSEDKKNTIEEAVNILKVELSDNKQINLNQLLYTIDIPESIIRVTQPEDLAEIIVIREAQKVYLREKFSSKDL